MIGSNRQTQPWASTVPARPLVRVVARGSREKPEPTKPAKLGRYHLLELVGSGGMGVVWGAWDPELERRVAIKLVKAELAAARDRILLEGQALAKLSHPNVVPVFDVGVVEEQVYLVMEWVRGENLRVWCTKPRTVREILAIYCAAGEGLSASHRAGLIHRDFKPDNAILGDDGRVRVLDFGLARGEVKSSVATESSDLTRGAGTPRFMPPEQSEGRELTPAVDQYAFCVSLRDALTSRDGEGKTAIVPAWIAPVLDRGCAREATSRFADMDELLRALARDPWTVWRRRVLAATIAGSAAAAFAIGTVRASADAPLPAIEACTGSTELIARSWSDPQRAKLISHVSSLGPYGVASAQRFGSALDDYASDWALAHHDACRAKERKELTDAQYEHHRTCLARSRFALETVIGVLADADAQLLASSAIAVDGLPRPERCSIETESASIDPPAPQIAHQVAEVGSELERARLLALAQQRDAVESAAAAVTRAKQLEYGPLVARAQLAHGLAMVILQSGDTKTRVEALQQALASALEAGDHVTALEAYARLIPELVKTGLENLPPDAKQVLGAIPLMAAMAKSVDPSGAFARALLYNNIGTVHYTTGDHARARQWFNEAREAREPIREQYPELNIVWENLGLVADTVEERTRMLELASSEIEARLGRDHPNAISARVNAAMLVDDPARALTQLREPCRAYQVLHPHLEQRIGDCLFEIGWIAEQRGDLVESRAAMAAIGATSEYEHAIARGYLMLFDGRPHDALRAMTAVAEEYLASADPWTRFRGANAQLVIAASQERLNRTRAAIATLEQALVTLRELAVNFKSAPFYQRRVARVHAALERLRSKP